MTTATNTTKLLLTLTEAAEALSVSEKTLWRLAKNKEVPSVRVGPRGLRFRLAALQTWIEKQEKMNTDRDSGKHEDGEIG